MAEYIDREAFKKSVEERYCKPCKAEKKDHNGCWCRACWVDDMLDEVDCFQTADVAPVAHGRWGTGRFNLETGNYEEQCTRCRNFSKEYGKPYCSNCGAKMKIKNGGDNDAKSM